MDCQKAFKRKDYLTVHRKLVHTFIKHSMLLVDTLKQSDGSYKCNNCGEVFSGLKADEHIVTAHIVEKFRRAEEFKRHKKRKLIDSKRNHKKLKDIDSNKKKMKELERNKKRDTKLQRQKLRKRESDLKKRY